MKIYCNYCGKTKLMRDKPSTRFCSPKCCQDFYKEIKVRNKSKKLLMSKGNYDKSKLSMSRDALNAKNEKGVGK